MESEKHGERVRQRERQRGSSAFWLRLWPQSRIQLVAAQTRIAQYGRLELESSAISVLSIAAFANSKIVLIEVPRNRSLQNDQNQSQKRGVSQVPFCEYPANWQPRLWRLWLSSNDGQVCVFCAS